MKTADQVLKEFENPHDFWNANIQYSRAKMIKAMEAYAAQKEKLIEAQEELIKLYEKWWDDDLWHDDEGIPMDERRKFIQICRRIKELKKEEI